MSNIEQLGDEIANLTLREAVELSRYLDWLDGMGPVGAMVPNPKPLPELSGTA